MMTTAVKDWIPGIVIIRLSYGRYFTATGGKDKRFQIDFSEIETVHVRTDNVELFSLFDPQRSINSDQDFHVGRLYAFCAETRDISNFF